MDFKVRKISKAENKKKINWEKLLKNAETLIKKNYKLSITILVILVIIGLVKSLNGTQKLTELVTSSITDNIQKNKFDYTNILVTGVGGEKHDGAYLTDSIILASVNPKK